MTATTLQESLCQNPDCTVAETGQCLLGHENYANECPEYQILAAKDEPGEEMPIPIPADDEAVGIMSTRRQGRRFWSGSELGLDDAHSIMQAKYTHLIGVVGPTGTGKTCFLNSLYLMSSSNSQSLKHYKFAGSLTLPGFEERVSFARVWRDGQIPETLSARTLRQDPRQPGFMHLRLADVEDVGLTHEILLTDLPGVWFEKLVSDAKSAEHLMFLNRADGILFFVDAEQLLNINTRHNEVHRAKLLFERLAQDIHVSANIPIIIIISKIDAIKQELSNSYSIFGADEIIQHAQLNSFNPELVYTASFSRCPELIPNSHGVEYAIRLILNSKSVIPSINYHLVPSPSIERSFAQFTGKPIKRIPFYKKS